MNKIKNIVIGISVLFIIFFGCDKEMIINYSIEDSGLIADKNPLNEKSKRFIEGVYEIIEGNEIFGDLAVVKSTNDYFSLFCKKNEAYFILKSGEKDTNFYFEGSWRYSRSSTNGKIALNILKKSGGKEAFLNTSNKTNLVINGYYGSEFQNLASSFKAKYLRQLNPDSSFNIIAHRGGGRNSDRLPASENSLELIKIAEYFGANSVEIDVQLTKDNIPILFHDEEFTQRLVKGNYLIGKVSNFSFKQIRTFGKLIHDEKIPTLNEALDVIVRNTKIKLVWIDAKQPAAIPVIAKIQKEYLDLAKVLNRNLSIVIGLPTAEVMDEYNTLSNKEYYPSLCELDINSVRKSNSIIWAPRWTEGILQQQINSMHSEARLVFVWTLDLPNMISEYYLSDLYDGILTNYPSLLAFEHYSKQE